jgi:hypothetical protein
MIIKTKGIGIGGLSGEIGLGRVEHKERYHPQIIKSIRK